MASKNPPDPKQEQPVTDTEPLSAAMLPAAEQAGELARQAAAAPVRLANDAAASLAVSAQAVPVEASESDITDELERGGPAFGSFVKSVGLAVAEAQEELDKTLVKTAKVLSETQIDVIAIFEQVVNDDDGTMAQGNIIMQKLPLINYLMPTAYKWSRVYLEADMTVSEFNSANGFNISKTKAGMDSSAAFGFGMGSFGVSADTNFDYSRTNTVTTTSTDKAAGSMHMEATLEPRDDIQLPRPFILQKGPRLRLSVTASEDITESSSGGTPVVVGRKVTISAELTKTDGSAHSGKSLQVSVDRNDLTFAMAAQETDSNGRLLIDIERRGGQAFDPATPRAAALVRVSFGLVTETLGISI
ncbi:MAG: hypothetical protein HZC41_19150 [Chloroflexi bacterium]|nr:hypothetical protein [Chloroflexota bacterium]